MRFGLTEKDVSKPLLSYTEFLECKRFTHVIKSLSKMMNNALTAELRGGSHIIDPIAEPYTVDDPKQHKPRTYRLAVLPCAKKTHLIYFLYMLEYRTFQPLREKKVVIRAPFIAIEGADYSGKTSQVKTILKALDDSCLFSGNAVSIRTPCGKLRNYLHDDESKDIPILTRAMINIASMTDLEHSVLRPQLACNKPVVSDRWVSTTYAFQCMGQGLDKRILSDLINACRLALPNLLIILDVSEKTVEARKLTRPEQQNHLDLLPPDITKAIRESYRRRLDGFITSPSVVVSGEGTQAEVAERIRDVVNKFLVTWKVVSSQSRHEI